MANPTRSETGDCTVIAGDARCLNLSLFNGQRYGVIIADPPWPYDNPKDHDPRMGGYTYQPMTLDEIKAMPVQALAADDAILFLWGTWPKLPQVIETMRAWGFEHVTGFPWVKTTQSGEPAYGIGSWVAGCSEYVLIGRRGCVSPPSEKYLGLVGPSLGHSRKQDAERLEMDVLGAVFDKRLAKHLGKTINPFCVSSETPFSPPQGSPPDRSASSGKKKRSSIAETLSTR
ncbi:MAG: hypothetical protein GY832_34615 [Chloroflexi bacterium]|nr:hypothetical protein [Chloroflexota bacterium]